MKLEQYVEFRKVKLGGCESSAKLSLVVVNRWQVKKVALWCVVVNAPVECCGWRANTEERAPAK